METMTFKNFDGKASGVVWLRNERYAFVLCMNPHGTENLVMVDEVSSEAVRHGTKAVLDYVYKHFDISQFKYLKAKCETYGLIGGV